MKRFLISGGLLFYALASGMADAQMIDMRAYSRQHGFKAYQEKTRHSVRGTRSAVKKEIDGEQAETVPSEKQSASGEKKPTSSRSEKKSLRQTGIKIFQEKDESKVMNFDVENPEFKKLNKEERQDLLNRITIE